MIMAKKNDDMCTRFRYNSREMVDRQREMVKQYHAVSMLTCYKNHKLLISVTQHENEFQISNTSCMNHTRGLATRLAISDSTYREFPTKAKVILKKMN